MTGSFFTLDEANALLPWLEDKLAGMIPDRDNGWPLSRSACWSCCADAGATAIPAVRKIFWNVKRGGGTSDPTASGRLEGSNRPGNFGAGFGPGSGRFPQQKGGAGRYTSAGCGAKSASTTGMKLMWVLRGGSLFRGGGASPTFAGLPAH